MVRLKPMVIIKILAPQRMMPPPLLDITKPNQWLEMTILSGMWKSTLDAHPGRVKSPKRPLLLPWQEANPPTRLPHMVQESKVRDLRIRDRPLITVQTLLLTTVRTLLLTLHRTRLTATARPKLSWSMKERRTQAILQVHTTIREAPLRQTYRRSVLQWDFKDLLPLMTIFRNTAMLVKI